MLSMILSVGRCLYYVGSVTYENKATILTAYSLFDTTKFAFFVSDKLGIIDLIKKKLTYTPESIILEISGIEKSELGEFEIIEK